MKRGAVFIVAGLIALGSVVAFLYVSHALKMRQVNVLAASHMNRMRLELISLSKTHPILRGIEQDHLEVPPSPHPTNTYSDFYCNEELLPRYTYCVLSFGRNMAWMESDKCMWLEPTRNGIRLQGIVTSYGNSILQHSECNEEWQLQAGRDELFISCELKLGENLKDMEAPVREVLHRHLQALYDDVRKQGPWIARKTQPEP